MILIEKLTLMQTIIQILEIAHSQDSEMPVLIVII